MISGSVEVVSGRRITVGGGTYEVTRNAVVKNADGGTITLSSINAGDEVELSGPPKGPLHTITVKTPVKEAQQRANEKSGTKGGEGVASSRLPATDLASGGKEAAEPVSFAKRTATDADAKDKAKEDESFDKDDATHMTHEQESKSNEPATHPRSIPSPGGPAHGRRSR